MEPTNTIEINLSALDENAAAWRAALVPGCEVCAVLKADAYGLGAGPIARRMAAAGVRTIAVYNMQQAAELVAANIPCNFLVLMPVIELDRTDPLYRTASTGRLHLTVHSDIQLQQIEAIGTKFGIKMPVHIEVDTGMSRLGMSVEEADRMITALQGRKYLQLAGIFSHAAAAGSDPQFTDRQYESFAALLDRHADRLKGVAIHFAGTCAAYRDQRYHQSMVRLGLGLFGYGDLAEEGIPTIDHPPQVKPIMRWLSRIVHTKSVPPRTGIGYQRTYLTKRATRLGIVPVGHADGYPVALSNKAVVRVGPLQHPAPVRGLVNMDQIIIDLTDLPQHVGLGEEVELISADPAAPNALPKLAEMAKTNCYELLCRLSPRNQRKYVIRHAATGRLGHVATV